MKKYLLLLYIGVFLVSSVFSKVYAATADSFVFTAVGDYGNDRGTSSNFTKLLEGIGKQQPDFHLALGDFIYSNTVSEVTPWCEHVKQHINIGAGKSASDAYGYNFPFELIAGNHDTGESNADIITITNSIRNCLPNKLNIVESTNAKKGTPSSSYAIEYYFDYPQSNPVARVILVSPDLFGWSYAKGTSNYNFVRDSILDARSKNIPWVIVGKHKNCITNGTKSCEYSQDLMNLLAGKDLGVNGGYGTPVDIVLEGHEHSYHRSKQLMANSTNCASIQTNGFNANCVSNPGPFNFNKGQGKILSIIGTGGVSLRSISGSSDNESGYFTSWMGTNQAFTGGVSNGGTNSWGFTKFTVTRTNLTAQFIATTGTYSDNFTISANGASPNPTVLVTPTPTLIATPTPTPTKVPTPTPQTSLLPTIPVSNCNNVVAFGKVENTFNTNTNGNYRIWLRAKKNDNSTPNVYIRTPNYCYKLDTNSLNNTTWQWTTPSNLFSLAQGSVKVEVLSDSAGIKIDDLFITNDTNCSPTGQDASCNNLYDFDGNGIVEVKDVIKLITKIFSDATDINPNSQPDINNDGKINLLDVILFLQNYFA